MADASVALCIRRYRAQDHDAVWALHNQALEAVDAHGGNGSWDDDLHDIEQVYLVPGGDFMVGTLPDLAVERIIVMGALRPLAETGHVELKRMRVHPDFWRCGHGRAMLEALEARARELGYRTVHLDTTTRQHAAQAFYRQAGYREVRRHQWHSFTVIDFAKDLG